MTETNGNGRVGIREVYDLLDKVYSRINTVAKEGTEQHKESMDAVAALDDKMDAHLKEANTRDRRLDRLEDRAANVDVLVKAQTREIVNDEHAKRHEAYARDHETRYVHMTRAEHEAMIERCLARAEKSFAEQEMDLGKMLRQVEKRVWVMWGVGIFILTSIASTIGNEVVVFIVGEVKKIGGG